MPLTASVTRAPAPQGTESPAKGMDPDLNGSHLLLAAAEPSKGATPASAAEGPPGHASPPHDDPAVSSSAPASGPPPPRPALGAANPPGSASRDDFQASVPSPHGTKPSIGGPGAGSAAHSGTVPMTPTINVASVAHGGEAARQQHQVAAAAPSAASTPLPPPLSAPAAPPVESPSHQHSATVLGLPAAVVPSSAALAPASSSQASKQAVTLAASVPGHQAIPRPPPDPSTLSAPLLSMIDGTATYPRTDAPAPFDPPAYQADPQTGSGQDLGGESADQERGGDADEAAVARTAERALEAEWLASQLAAHGGPASRPSFTRGSRTQHRAASQGPKHHFDELGSNPEPEQRESEHGPRERRASASGLAAGTQPGHVEAPEHDPGVTPARASETDGDPTEPDDVVHGDDSVGPASWTPPRGGRTSGRASAEAEQLAAAPGALAAKEATTRLPAPSPMASSAIRGAAGRALPSPGGQSMRAARLAAAEHFTAKRLAIEAKRAAEAAELAAELRRLEEGSWLASELAKPLHDEVASIPMPVFTKGRASPRSSTPSSQPKPKPARSMRRTYAPKFVVTARPAAGSRPRTLGQLLAQSPMPADLASPSFPGGRGPDPQLFRIAATSVAMLAAHQQLEKRAPIAALQAHEVRTLNANRAEVIRKHRLGGLSPDVSRRYFAAMSGHRTSSSSPRTVTEPFVDTRPVVPQPASPLAAADGGFSPHAQHGDTPSAWIARRQADLQRRRAIETAASDSMADPDDPKYRNAFGLLQRIEEAAVIIEKVSADLAHASHKDGGMDLGDDIFIDSPRVDVGAGHARASPSRKPEPEEAELAGPPKTCATAILSHLPPAAVELVRTASPAKQPSVREIAGERRRAKRFLRSARRDDAVPPHRRGLVVGSPRYAGSEQRSIWGRSMGTFAISPRTERSELYK